MMRCILDMSSVLRHLHSCGVVHRDVSCRNILVDSDGRCVLADLGLAAQQLPARDGQTPAVDESMTAVPVRWTSPEALKQPTHFDSKSDVWSLGVALWECTAGGRLPYSEHSTATKACIRPIISGQWRLQVYDTWGTDDSMSMAEHKLASTLRRLIRVCLTYEVDQRPDSEQLVHIVGREWEQWKAESGEEAHRLGNEWAAYHDEVQRRLGLTDRA